MEDSKEQLMEETTTAADSENAEIQIVATKAPIVKKARIQVQRFHYTYIRTFCFWY